MELSFLFQIFIPYKYQKELLIEPLRDWNQSQIVKFFTIPIPILHPMLVHLNVIFSYLFFMNMNNNIAKR